MTSRPSIESLVSKFTGFDADAPCIEYGGYRNPSGYGMLSRKAIHPHPLLAHRYAYILAHGTSLGDIEGMAVMHLCDNPACINPQHLKLGTLAENNADMKNKGRASRTHQPKGEKHGNAKLTEEQVRFIRDNYKPRDPQFGGMALGRLFGTKYTVIWAVANRKVWRHAC